MAFRWIEKLFGRNPSRPNKNTDSKNASTLSQDRGKAEEIRGTEGQASRPAQAVQTGMLAAGQTVTLGIYPQDADGTRQPIEWTVLDVREGRALLLSRKILDMKPFDLGGEPVFWRSCALHDWLNGDFVREAFSEEDLERIVLPEESDGMAEEICWKMAETEVDTECLSDRVFLLKAMDLVQYYPGKPWFCPGAGAQETEWVRKTYPENQPIWWLRTTEPWPMGDAPMASMVSPAETVGFSRISPDNLNGVRPALWLKLDGFVPQRHEITGGSFNISVNGQKIRPDSSGKLAVSFQAGTSMETVQSVLQIFANALTGDVKAANAIGSMYWSGHFLLQDEDLAFFWYRLAARAGDGEAQVNLYDCYEMGVGVKENHEKALKWIRKAADQGVPYAQARLGSLLVEDGDTQEGEQLLRAAVSQHGAKWESAALELGKALMLHPDHASKEEGLKWVSQAAEQGDPDALRQMVHVYCFGYVKGHPGIMAAFQNPVLGNTWNERGSEKGEPFCQALRAQSIWKTDPSRVDETMQLLEQAKAKNDYFAYYICGLIHEERQEYPQALEHYEKAATLGDRAAEKDAQRMRDLLAGSGNA